MGFGNLRVVAPEKRCTPAKAEVAAKGGVAVDAEKFFDVALGEFHKRKSRPLDFWLSSDLDEFRTSLSSPMDTMAERLAHALLERDMTAPDLIAATRQAGRKKISKAAIYFILDGTTKAATIRAGTVETICRILRIRRDWLLWGKGAMNADSGSAHQGGTPAADDDSVALQLGMRALLTTVLNRLPGTAEPFSDLLTMAAKDAGVPDDAGLLASLFGIAREARDAEEVVNQALRRTRSGGRTKPRK